MSFWQGFEKRAAALPPLGMRGMKGMLTTKVKLHKPTPMVLPTAGTGKPPSVASTVPTSRIPGASVPKMPKGSPKMKMQSARGVSSTSI